ncbi:hypothetical protein [Allorhizocola rhizosphaerae]|uniref:hypothetical protein n=1 Tax=Allorhizocola rhizosphaerae TaxID=1872709 RepID=UPI0013C32247|nr:hypothetical protein [Allorhizocola rhizosphaerae]
MSQGAGLLVVARLTICSSYSQNIEQAAVESFDTIQFYLPAEGDLAYRIRTFGLDHDIHVHGLSGRSQLSEEIVRAHLDRAYAAVTASLHTVALSRMSTVDLAEAGISCGELELVSDAGYLFWNPDAGHYTTKSEPIDPRQRQDMQEVIYLGGVARFWVPQSWCVEMSVEDGGQFYDPDGDTVLRLNVLTFDTSATAGGPPQVRHQLRPGQRPIDSGRLTAGYEFDVYEQDDIAEGTTVRYWQIAQVLPGQCRIYVFSYAYTTNAGHAIANELATIDREIRRMIPYPEPL